MNLELDKLKNLFGKKIILNESLSKYSWFNLGGPASILFKPDSINQLIDFLKHVKNSNKIICLGAGSNTLIRDKGVRGVVIKLGSNFSKVNLISKDTIEAGAATLDRKISNFAKDNSIGNLEFLSCIPGSIGGAVIMNSGCYGNDISKVLISIKVIDLVSCQLKEIKRDEIEFYYRGSNLSDKFLITSVMLKGKIDIKESIEKNQKILIEKKKASQPSQVKSCGSTFKNINEEKKAWKIIKETGCDKYTEGDASISKHHCNFFVNNGKANSTDIEKLIDKVKQTVSDKTGINLELEIKIIGE